MTDLTDALGQPFSVPQTAGAIGEPHVGEAWLVNWDDHDLAVVVIAAVRPAHVLAWPMTVRTGREGYPCLPVHLSEENPELVAWPDAEFGLSTGLLESRVGEPLTSKQVRLIVGALTDGSEMPVPTCSAPDSDEARRDLDAVCSQAWTLGDIDWPSAVEGQGVFNRDALVEAGLNGRSLSAELEVTPARAARLFAGEAIPSHEEIEAVATLGAAREGLLRSPQGDEVDAMLHPKFKARLREVMARNSLDEGQARTKVVVHALQMAAREQQNQSANDAALTRIEAAFHALLSE